MEYIGLIEGFPIRPMARVWVLWHNLAGVGVVVRVRVKYKRKRRVRVRVGGTVRVRVRVRVSIRVWMGSSMGT